jgi:tetratricopeptide (TPR) repeat protein
MLGRIGEAAGGNPLFLEEMLRMLEDDGVLRHEDDRWRIVGDLDEVRVPGSIQALLGARIDRLTPEERTVLRCAAVVGKVFWWGAIAELVPPPLRATVGTHLQTLVRKDLIRPERSSLTGEDAFRFHHILIQEAAYAATPKQDRADLHERFATWTERVSGERATELEEVIGYHLEQAVRLRAELAQPGEHERALALRGGRHLAAAGSRASERRDLFAATDLLGRAERLLPEHEPDRLPVLLALGEALGEMGEFARAGELLDEAERVAGRLGQANAAASAAIMRLFLLESTDPKRLSWDAVREAERQIETLEREGDDAGLARAWRLMGDLHHTHSRFAAADEAYARSIEHARAAGARRDEADALGRYAGTGLYGPATVEEIERRCDELRAATAGTSFEAPAFRALAGARAMQGRFDEARELAIRARSTLEDAGLRLRASWVASTSGEIEVLAGDVAAAERAFREGFDAAVGFGEIGYQATVAAQLAHALLDAGRVEEAERFARVSEETAAEDDLASQVLQRSARARILAARGDPTPAVAEAREAVALAETTDDVNMRADALVDLAEVLRRSGAPEDAKEPLDRATELYRAKGNVAAIARLERRIAAIGAG